MGRGSSQVRNSVVRLLDLNHEGYRIGGVSLSFGSSDGSRNEGRLGRTTPAVRASETHGTIFMVEPGLSGIRCIERGALVLGLCTRYAGKRSSFTYIS
jgi:hypothetical protein